MKIQQISTILRTKVKWYEFVFPCRVPVSPPFWWSFTVELLPNHNWYFSCGPTIFRSIFGEKVLKIDLRVGMPKSFYSSILLCSTSFHLTFDDQKVYSLKRKLSSVAIMKFFQKNFFGTEFQYRESFENVCQISVVCDRSKSDKNCWIVMS